MALLRPCATSAGFTATPDSSRRLDMPRLTRVLQQAGYTILADARILLVVRPPTAAGPGGRHGTGPGTETGSRTDTGAAPGGGPGPAPESEPGTAPGNEAGRTRGPPQGGDGVVESSVHDNGRVLLKTTDRDRAQAAYDALLPHLEATTL